MEAGRKKEITHLLPTLTVSLILCFVGKEARLEMSWLDTTDTPLPTLPKSLQDKHIQISQGTTTNKAIFLTIFHL